MRILLVGVNHRTAPLELREKLALPAEQMDALHAALRHRFPASECVILSTCNRVELYIARPTHEPPTGEDLRQFLATQCNVAIEELTPVTIQREQERAVDHLFRVCCGLDSMVLGEPQIQGQVKRAYDQAVAAEAVGPVLHRVFQQALASAKHVRTETGIDAGRVSVGSVAVDFARQIFADFSDKTILGIGAGDMAKATLRHLQVLKPHRLWLVNRTPARALALAETLRLQSPRGGARHWEELDELLIEADVVLTGTGSREPVLTAALLKPLQKRRRNRPLFIIDIAVPRDVAQDVGALSNVYLYNIDDLQSVVATNVDQRREQIAHCEAHLAEAVAACVRQVQHRNLGQLVRQLRHRLHELGELEQQRTRRKLGNLANDPTGEAMDELLTEHTHRLINKILHLPLSQLDHRDADAPLGFYAAALRRLFDLDDTAEPTESHEPASHNDEPV